MPVRRASLLVCSLALLLAVCAQPALSAAEPADASAARKGKGPRSGKCKRGLVRRGGRCVKPPAPTIKSGHYGGYESFYLEVDTKARTVAFFFRLPCTDSDGQLYGTTGTTPVQGGLAGTKPGTTVTLSGSNSRPAEGGFGIQTTTWDMTGKFIGTRHFEGNVHFVADIPPPGPQFLGAHCETTTRIYL